MTDDYIESLKRQWCLVFDLLGVEYNTDTRGVYDNVMTIRTARHDTALLVLAPIRGICGDGYDKEEKDLVRRLCGTDKTGFIFYGSPKNNQCYVYCPCKRGVPEWIRIKFGIKPDMTEDEGIQFYYENNFTDKGFTDPICAGTWIFDNIDELSKSPEYGYTRKYFEIIDRIMIEASVIDVRKITAEEREEAKHRAYADFCRIRYTEVLEPRIAAELLSIYERQTYDNYMRLATYNHAGAKPEFSEAAWLKILDTKAYANAYTQFRKTNIEFDFSECWGLKNEHNTDTSD